MSSLSESLRPAARPSPQVENAIRRVIAKRHRLKLLDINTTNRSGLTGLIVSVRKKPDKKLGKLIDELTHPVAYTVRVVSNPMQRSRWHWLAFLTRKILLC